MHLPIVTGIIFMFQTVNDAPCESNRLQPSSPDKPQGNRKNISENVLKAICTFRYAKIAQEILVAAQNSQARYGIFLDSQKRKAADLRPFFCSIFTDALLQRLQIPKYSLLQKHFLQIIQKISACFSRRNPLVVAEQ